MELNWTHIIEKNYLECRIDETLLYRAYKGGYKIKKYVNDELVDVILRVEGDDYWENEKHWISDNYSHIVGKYKTNWKSVREQNAWMERNDWTQEFPVFGLSKQGEYLDRLQRPTRVQTGLDMKTILKNDGHHIMLEIDTEGNYWQRPYCDEQKTFYNVQPCCVFPENPGRKSVSKEEAERLIEKYSR